MKKESKLTLTLFIIYLAVLTWIILFKMQFSFTSLNHTRRINLIPFASSVIANGKIYYNEIINNLIVFIPVGLYLSMLKPGWPFLKKICPIFALSFAYEIFQFIFAIGASDITDLISNTMGGIVGIIFYLFISKCLKRKTNRVLNILAVICTVAVIALLTLLIVSNRF